MLRWGFIQVFRELLTSLVLLKLNSSSFNFHRVMQLIRAFLFFELDLFEWRWPRVSAFGNSPLGLKPHSKYGEMFFIIFLPTLRPLQELSYPNNRWFFFFLRPLIDLAQFIIQLTGLTYKLALQIAKYTTRLSSVLGSWSIDAEEITSLLFLQFERFHSGVLPYWNRPAW